LQAYLPTVATIYTTSELPDASFDTVLCALSLGSILDGCKVIAEMRRVLRPGGRPLLPSHIRTSSRLGSAVQRLLEPLAIRFGGDHLLRGPLEHFEAQGFVVERWERYKLGMVERLCARKPGSG
jgi:SAM-dependent methyltransferase